jgi:hypothetical protein
MPVCRLEYQGVAEANFVTESELLLNRAEAPYIFTLNYMYSTVYRKKRLDSHL